MLAVVNLGRYLLNLAAQGVAPLVGGCAGALVGQQAGSTQLGRAVGQGVEQAIDRFGRWIAEKWEAWFRSKPPEEQRAALAELAALPPEEARREAAEVVERLAPDASDADRAAAVEYLAAIPGAVSRSLLPDRVAGKRTVPAALRLDDPRTLLRLLPVDVPPYPAPCPLPGTPYRLEELAGTGGFGAVYRATMPKLQHLPFAVKFCLDPSLLESLRRERGNLERLIRAGGESWSPRVVKLFGCDLDHPTPFLVYEFVPGGDLARRVAELAAGGTPPTPEQVRGWVTEIAEGLGFAHKHGLVHRDLKPANVLCDGATLKLADFGIGGVTATGRAGELTRAETVGEGRSRPAAGMSLLSGAGTPLYMSPEQRRGEPPDPRQDVYALGVIWFQLLVGDVAREMHPGWAEELADQRVPPEEIDLIRRCVGLPAKRPADGTELLALLREEATFSRPIPVAASPPPAADANRSRKLLSLLRRLRETHIEAEKAARTPFWTGFAAFWIGFFTMGIIWEAMMGVGLAIGWGERGHPNPGVLMVFYFLGVLLGTGPGLLTGRWFLRARRRKRVEPFEREVGIQADLLAEVFPKEVEGWGGRDALLRAANVERVCRVLEVTEAT